MPDPIGSLHAKITRAVSTNHLSVYQADLIHAALSARPQTASAIEFVSLKIALSTATAADLITQAQLESIYKIIPELEGA